MDTNIMLAVRAQGLAQFTAQNEDPGDVLFVADDSSILNSSMIPYQGELPPSKKYEVRKLVVRKILDKSLHPVLHAGKQAFFFSYEPIYDLDYAFVINLYTNRIDLYLSRKGKVLKQYNNFNLSTDERNDIMYL